MPVFPRSHLNRFPSASIGAPFGGPFGGGARPFYGLRPYSTAPGSGGGGSSSAAADFDNGVATGRGDADRLLGVLRSNGELEGRQAVPAFVFTAGPTFLDGYKSGVRDRGARFEGSFISAMNMTPFGRGRREGRHMAQQVFSTGAPVIYGLPVTTDAEYLRGIDKGVQESGCVIDCAASSPPPPSLIGSLMPNDYKEAVVNNLCAVRAAGSFPFPWSTWQDPRNRRPLHTFNPAPGILSGAFPF